MMSLQWSIPATWLELVIMLLVSLVFLTSGITHFTNTAFYLSIMPPLIPSPLLVVYLTAVVELILLAGLWVAKTRYYSAIGLIIFCLLVYPANIYMAMYPDRFPQYTIPALYVRLVLQFVLIYFVWLVRGPYPK